MKLIACTLSPEERPVRLAEIESLGRDALIGATADGALRFRNDPAIRARLGAVVAAEARCCPFLELDLSADGAELRLAIRAPVEAEPVARELAAAFAEGKRRM
jgi:MerR family transcriptional regulator, copper efflux regulator